MLAIGTKNMSKIFREILNFPEYLKDKEIKYIETSIDYNNDLYYRDLPEDITVITRIQSLDNLDLTLGFHRNKLGENREYIYLFPVGREEYPDSIINSLGNIGLYGVTGSLEIDDFIDKTGKVPDYVSLRINPLFYPKSTLEYCKSKDIKTIGYEIFGGDLFYGYLKEMFPEKFFLEFASHNTDLQVLSSDDIGFLMRAPEEYSRINIQNTKLYEYSKDINALPGIPKPGRKIYGHGIIKLPGGIEIQGEFGGYYESSGTHRMGTTSKGEEDPEMTEKFKDIVIPKDLDLENLPELQAYHRYYCGPCFDELFSPKVWRKLVSIVAPGITLIKIIPRSWLGWMTKEHAYLILSVRGERLPKIYKIPIKSAENLIIEG